MSDVNTIGRIDPPQKKQREAIFSAFLVEPLRKVRDWNGSRAIGAGVTRKMP